MLPFHREETRHEVGQHLPSRGLRFPACLAALLHHVTEFWPKDEGERNLYHLEAWLLNTCLATLYTSFPLREFTPSKMISVARFSVFQE